MKVITGECPLGAKCEQVQDNVIVRCPWYIRVVGTDNNTGELVDRYNCAISWLPTLLVNTSHEVRQGAAATESFRNEMVQQSKESIKALCSIRNIQLENRRVDIQALNEALD